MRYCPRMPAEGPQSAVGASWRVLPAPVRSAVVVRVAALLCWLVLAGAPSLVRGQTTESSSSPAAAVTAAATEAATVEAKGSATEDSAAAPASDRHMVSVSKASVLVGSLTVFLLSVFVGFEVITKVPPTLHTPLMSGSNAISGITIVGAILTAGSAVGGFGSLLGLLAVVLAMINVVGGFLVTHRMLMMFKKR